MTIDEIMAREAIRHTLAQYNVAGDRLRKEEYLSSFTDDAIFDFTTRTGGAQRYSGVDEIRAWLSTYDSDPTSQEPQERRLVRHHLTTCLIELTTDVTAKSRTYFAAYTTVGLDHIGQYIDAFQRVGDRWLIAHREVRTDWFAPNSLA